LSFFIRRNSTFAGKKPLFFQFNKNGKILSITIKTYYKIDSTVDSSGAGVLASTNKNSLFAQMGVTEGFY
jgi:hypothetical protein